MKISKEFNKKNKKGITLIALVITIIILLILAGVTVNTLGGENGLFARAKQARIESVRSEAQEQFRLILTEDVMDNIGVSKTNAQKIALFQAKGYDISEENGEYILDYKGLEFKVEFRDGDVWVVNKGTGVIEAVTLDSLEMELQSGFTCTQPQGPVLKVVPIVGGENNEQEEVSTLKYTFTNTNAGTGYDDAADYSQQLINRIYEVANGDETLLNALVDEAFLRDIFGEDAGETDYGLKEALWMISNWINDKYAPLEMEGQPSDFAQYTSLQDYFDRAWEKYEDQTFADFLHIPVGLGAGFYMENVDYVNMWTLACPSGFAGADIIVEGQRISAIHGVYFDEKDKKVGNNYNGEITIYLDSISDTSTINDSGEIDIEIIVPENGNHTITVSNAGGATSITNTYSVVTINDSIFEFDKTTQTITGFKNSAIVDGSTENGARGEFCSWYTNEYNNTSKGANGFKLKGITGSQLVIPNTIGGVEVKHIAGLSYEGYWCDFGGRICLRTENNNTEITSIVISNGIETIEDYCFKGLANITSVTLPNTLTSIGEQAFYKCASLSSITLPNTLTSIGNEAFACYADYDALANNVMTSIIIPSSVTTMGYRAIGYTGLTNIYCRAAAAGENWNESWNGTSVTPTYSYTGN